MKIMNFSYKYIFWICFLSLLFSFGCVQKKVTPTKKEPPKKKQVVQVPIKKQKIKKIKQKYFIHTVKWDGESMSLIARWYIGNYEAWKLLAKHNPDLNPYNIHVKDKVRIPKEKMKTKEPMPESFLNKYTTKKKKKEKKTIELYGPKEHEEEVEENNHDL